MKICAKKMAILNDTSNFLACIIKSLVSEVILWLKITHISSVNNPFRFLYGRGIGIVPSRWLVGLWGGEKKHNELHVPKLINMQVYVSMESTVMWNNDLSRQVRAYYDYVSALRDKAEGLFDIPRKLRKLHSSQFIHLKSFPKQKPVNVRRAGPTQKILSHGNTFHLTDGAQLPVSFKGPKRPTSTTGINLPSRFVCTSAISTYSLVPNASYKKSLRYRGL